MKPLMFFKQSDHQLIIFKIDVVQQLAVVGVRF